MRDILNANGRGYNQKGRRQMNPRDKGVAMKILAASIVSFSAGYYLKETLRDSIYLPLRALARLDTSYREEVVQCPRRAFSVAIFGQSNSANFVNSRYSEREIPENLLQFDWSSGKCYKYKEPLVGADGLGGNAITPFAVKAARSWAEDVIIIPFGVGGSSILEWSDGYLGHYLNYALEMMRRSQIKPAFFLFHQGESDAKSPGSSRSSFKDLMAKNKQDLNTQKVVQLGISEESYFRGLEKIVQLVKREFPQAGFGIALASKSCNKKGTRHEPIRRAQKRISETVPGTFLIADSDEIKGTRYRYDNCHFSREGAIKLSEEYSRSVKRYMATGWTGGGDNI